MYTLRSNEVLICPKFTTRIPSRKRLFVNIYFLRGFDTEKMFLTFQENLTLFFQSIK